MVYREIGRRGLIAGSSGNVSHRTVDGMIITPSGCAAETLQPESLVSMTLGGDVQGNIAPSSEWAMHAAIYLACPVAQCIVHTHAKHVIALSAAGHDFHVVGQNGGRLFEECVTFDEDDGTALGKGPGEAMARALGPRSAMMLKNHGLLTAGTTIAEAVLMAITMDEEAEIQLLALGATGRLSLPSREGSLRCKQYVRSELLTQRGWAYFLRKLERQRPDVFEM